MSGLPFTIIRPHNVYGPNMGLRHVIPQLFEKAYHSKLKYEVYSPSHTRTFCYISGAINMIFNLMKNRDAVGEVINLGNERTEISIKKLAKLILKITKKIIYKGNGRH